MTWRDMSDPELLGRLHTRGITPEVAGALVVNRDHPRNTTAAEVIDQLLDPEEET